MTLLLRLLTASLSGRMPPLALLVTDIDAYACHPEAVACWRCPAPLKHED